MASRGGRQAAYRYSRQRWREVEDTAVAAAVAQCFYAADVLRMLALDLSGGNYLALRRRIALLRLDTKHWLRGRPPAGRSFSTILIPAGYTNRYRLKLRLLRAGLLRNECYECGSPPEWRGQPLTLVLDHVNGVSTDYTPQNLRLLCPNCNSQTPTFGGRNKKRRRLVTAESLSLRAKVSAGSGGGQ